MVGDVWSKLDVDVYFDELSWVEIRKFMNMYERLKPETKILILSTQQKYLVKLISGWDVPAQNSSPQKARTEHM